MPPTHHIVFFDDSHVDIDGDLEIDELNGSYRVTDGEFTLFFAQGQNVKYVSSSEPENLVAVGPDVFTAGFRPNDPQTSWTSVSSGATSGDLSNVLLRYTFGAALDDPVPTLPYHDCGPACLAGWDDFEQDRWDDFDSGVDGIFARNVFPRMSIFGPWLDRILDRAKAFGGPR